MKRKALVAMSGGVDSAVAALLLRQEGLECMGATMRLMPSGTREDPHACCTVDDAYAARAVARTLGMQHYVFNETDAFERDVIARFAAGYLAGETPNPCLDCNRYLKFGTLLQRALLLGCDAVATGHYARIAYNEEARRWQLLRAVDEAKDQSYVLYMLTQEQLAHTLLPLGGLHKSEVRALAAQNNFVNAEKPESQDICFVANHDYAAFIRDYTGTPGTPGPMCDTQGRVIGQHCGLEHYTVGQRRGLGVSAAYPLYVCQRRCADNTLVVGPREALNTTEFVVRDVNWLSIPCPEHTVSATVRTRYHQRETPVQITPLPNGCAHIAADTPLTAPAPGQAAVFYSGDLVLGGGIITAPDALPR
jgi:tRNA-specific 2-thiouridylase